MSAVHTKDHLLGILNESRDTDTLLNNVNTVLTVLENTEGMWQECNYCYKACEIAMRCRENLDTIDQTHHKRRERVERFKRRAWALEDKYHALQQESWQMTPA